MSIAKSLGRIGLGVVIAGAIAAGGLYAVAPKPIKAEKPSVVKSYAVVQYASWCPLCKELDPKIEAAKNDAVKAGVEIETFDFTDEAASKASLAKAKSLGLEKFVTEGATGFATLVNAEKTKSTGRIVNTESFEQVKSDLLASVKS